MSSHPDDLQQPGNTDSGNASVQQPPAGQSQTSDWENRFKGLQREFNQLQRKHDAQLNLASDYQTQLQEANAQLTTVTQQYEGQLGQFRSDLGSRDTELESLRTQHEQLTGTVSELTRDQSIRKELSKPDYQSLLPWYDSGMLKTDGLEGDELTSHLNTFKEMLGQKTAQDFQSTMGSTTPASITNTSQSASGGMSQDELATWINKNPDHADFNRYYEQYMSVVADEPLP